MPVAKINEIPQADMMLLSSAVGKVAVLVNGDELISRIAVYLIPARNTLLATSELQAGHHCRWLYAEARTQERTWPIAELGHEAQSFSDSVYSRVCKALEGGSSPSGTCVVEWLHRTVDCYAARVEDRHLHGCTLGKIAFINRGNNSETARTVGINPSVILVWQGAGVTASVIPIHMKAEDFAKEVNRSHA